MPLPKQGMYELQIVEPLFLFQHPGYKDPVSGVQAPPEDQWTLIVELMGTSNPEDEGKPFKGRVWNIKKGKATTLAWLDQKTGAPKATNLGNVLIGLGLVTFEEAMKLKFDDVNIPAMQGLFLNSFVKHKADGKNFDIKATGLIALDNEEQQRINNERKADILKGA